MNKKKIGARLRSIRAENGLTQAAMADTLGVDRSTIAKIENGENLPSSAILIKLNQKFNVSIDWLLIGEGDRTFQQELEQDVKELIDEIQNDKLFKHMVLTYFYDYKVGKRTRQKNSQEK